MIALDRNRQKVVLAGTALEVKGATVRVMSSNRREITLTLPPGTQAEPGDDLIFLVEVNKKHDAPRVISCYPSDVPVDEFRRIAVGLCEVLGREEEG